MPASELEGYRCLCFFSAGITVQCCVWVFKTCVSGMGMHACMASHLLTELSPQPVLRHFELHFSGSYSSLPSTNTRSSLSS